MKIDKNLNLMPLKYRHKATRDGLVPIIVQSKDPELLRKLRSLCLEAHKTNQVKCDLPIINGFATLIDPRGKWPFSNPDLPQDKFKVSLDQKVSIPHPNITQNENVKPRLDIADSLLKMPEVWAKGATGKGVGIAIIDTGIDAKHPDFKDKVVAFYDQVNKKDAPYDDEGHGTHVSGDAAGSGAASSGKYKGTAPEANLIGVKVLDKNGSGSVSDVIKGVEFAVNNKDKYNIKVINMSLGGTPQGSYKDDPLCQALEVAVNQGIIPVVAAGNSGPFKNSISTPGHAPFVITVGAWDDNGTVDPKDDAMAWFTSRGPTKYDKLVKPDLSSPGMDIMAPKAGSNEYESMSGTSMAAPIVAGIVADLLQAKPDLAPAQVKELLKKTADSLPKVDENIQGKGLVDPLEALIS